jgi:hypothetical protein
MNLYRAFADLLDGQVSERAAWRDLEWANARVEGRFPRSVRLTGNSEVGRRGHRTVEQAAYVDRGVRHR